MLSGTVLATGDGRVAVSFADALSLRLDRGTRLRFDGHERVTLLQGALYVDSGGLNVGPPLTIATPAGEVRHVGTQFQVRVSGEITEYGCARAACSWTSLRRSRTHGRGRPTRNSWR